MAANETRDGIFEEDLAACCQGCQRSVISCHRIHRFGKDGQGLL